MVNLRSIFLNKNSSKKNNSLPRQINNKLIKLLSKEKSKLRSLTIKNIPTMIMEREF